MNAKSDEQLLADHLSGVSGAFDQLVARYANELYGFLCRFVANSSAAEDLVQETFIQVHAAAGTFDRERSFKPWLYTIAANKGRDYLRSRGRRQEYSIDATPGDNEGAAPSSNLESGDETQPEHVEREETQQRVRALVSKMPEHLRLILMLGYFQQLSYAEIAEVLGIPVGTVKSRLHAAVNQFAKLWRNETKTSSIPQ